MRKTKFNQEKCLKCKWHCNMSGGSKNGICCNYGLLHKKSCLYRLGRGIADIRGYDYNNCLKFERGKPVRDLAHWKAQKENGLIFGGGERVEQGQAETETEIEF